MNRKLCRQVNWKHIDGPLMSRTDGTLKWLSLRERFMHWIGRWSLEDIARREDGISKPVYYPPHDTWLNLRADDALAAGGHGPETRSRLSPQGRQSGGEAVTPERNPR